MNQKGIAKIEYFFAGLVLAVLVSLVMPKFFSSSEQGRYAAHQQERRVINEKIEAFHFKYGYYPQSMSKGDWLPPDGSDVDAIFEGKFPSNCPFGIAWSIRGGRIDMVPHAGHEEDLDSSAQELEAQRAYINIQLKKYAAANGYLPEDMSNQGWIGGNGESYRDYFPEGVPEMAPNGLPWEIDQETGQLK